MTTLSWFDSISLIKGVGPQTTKKFNHLGIETVMDLLFHFPFRYDNIQVRQIDTILNDEKVTLKGMIVSQPVVHYFGHRKSRLVFRVGLEEGNVIGVTFFNQPYLAKQLELGQQVAVYGKWQKDAQNLLGMKLIQASILSNDFDPIYSTTKGLRQGQIVQAIQRAFVALADDLDEPVPEYLNIKYRFLPLKEALFKLHFPKDQADRRQGERKIIFQEFFIYQWQIQGRRHQTHLHAGIPINYDNQELKELIHSLPFKLTNAQQLAVNEICFDLRAHYPMRRLLQGDVGSGKTIVAFIAMNACVIAGYQVAFMVPTEILARQHYHKFNQLFNPMGLKAELLTSMVSPTEKTNILDGLKSQRIRILIGTHAIIQPNVEFGNLALLIIDEQHRFGVEQRQALMDKGPPQAWVNVLQMTATPIPRSLALTVFGDMSVSTIDELPQGRQKISTKWVRREHLDQVYQLMESQLEKGHQVYYVLPLINESDSLQEVENVNNTVARISQEFNRFQIAALHGQLSKEEQHQVMEDFKANQIQILVATTMIEVGIDVANATVMVIQSAERFGLAQLHQLRGRVGRSHLPSYCYLVGDPTTEHGQERLAIMEKETDGFIISEQDMKLRGIGDLTGVAQSGMPSFHYANLIEDQTIHQYAMKEVQYLLHNKEDISKKEQDTLEQWSNKSPIQI